MKWSLKIIVISILIILLLLYSIVVMKTNTHRPASESLCESLSEEKCMPECKEDQVHHVFKSCPDSLKCCVTLN